MLYIGTCSWKYPSWEGFVYDKNSSESYLSQYSKIYSSVEIDQWFWSLFYNQKKDKLTVALPKLETVHEYVSSVPDNFQFIIKVPNSLTLTHVYKKQSGKKTVENPHFLSSDLFYKFIQTLEPMRLKIGCLIFQFEYLNQDKMSSLKIFLNKLEIFFSQINCPYRIALEPRNPNYLKPMYFEFLNSVKIYHVFLSGYFMPSISEYFESIEGFLRDYVVIRLHGDNRENIEKLTSETWDKIVITRDPEINSIIEILQKLISRKIIIQLNVNNHYEGSAPKTIEKIESKLTV